MTAVLPGVTFGHRPPPRLSVPELQRDDPADEPDDHSDERVLSEIRRDLSSHGREHHARRKLLDPRREAGAGRTQSGAAGTHDGRHHRKRDERAASATVLIRTSPVPVPARPVAPAAATESHSSRNSRASVTRPEDRRVAPAPLPAGVGREVAASRRGSLP